MKVNAEKILLEKNLDLKKNMFFVSGNEETLINKIKTLLITKLKEKDFNEVEYFDSIKINISIKELSGSSLFSSKKIMVFKNPTIENFTCLENIDEQVALIILNTNSKKNLKVKKRFDSDKNLYSIVCYELSKAFKKRFFDIQIGFKKINISKEAYWYFLDYSDNKYQIYENELSKLFDYSEKKISLNIIKLLLSKASYEKAELLFFSILSSSEKIIEQTREELKTQSDNYLFLQRTKFFIDIITRSNNSNELLSLFPRYLFNENEKIVTIYNKLNKDKIITIYNLIKKAELLFRLHTNMQTIISQRLLLNLKRILS